MVSLNITIQRVCCILLQAYQHTEPRSNGSPNKSYIEERHTNEPRPKDEHTDENVNSRPFPYTGGDLQSSYTPPPQPLTNMGPASSFAVPRTNLRSPETQPYYMEVLQPQHRYQQPPAPIDNSDWQSLNRMPVQSDLKGGNEANEQIRVRRISRMDSERSFQPFIMRPSESNAFPRVDLRSPATRTDGEYVEPRQGFHYSMASADNHKQPPLRRLSVPHDVSENNGPEEQRKAPQLQRRESDRPAYRPPASTANPHR